MEGLARIISTLFRKVRRTLKRSFTEKNSLWYVYNSVVPLVPCFIPRKHDLQKVFVRKMQFTIICGKSPLKIIACVKLYVNVMHRKHQGIIVVVHVSTQIYRKLKIYAACHVNRNYFLQQKLRYLFLSILKSIQNGNGSGHECWWQGTV